MSQVAQLVNAINEGALNEELALIYGSTDLAQQRRRWIKLLENVTSSAGEQYALFRSPGRTEIGGNHTDHNHGQVLVATINADIIAAVSPQSEPRITIHNCDDGSRIEIDCAHLDVQESERGESSALVRGVTAALQRAGLKIKGFKAFTSATLPLGKGLSSSAAFEALIAVILQWQDNHTKLSLVELAKASQYAENHYFGKPCGLEDQIGALNGGLTAIDFKDLEALELQRVNVNLHDYNLQLAVVDSKDSHASLTPHYAAIPQEMRNLAGHWEHEVLRPIAPEQFISAIPFLRSHFGDRAVLRGLHYFRENQRVAQQLEALQQWRIADFLKLVRQSGYSSWMLLQNCIVPGEVQQQGMALTLAVTEDFIRQRGLVDTAAYRVHGGGFAGAIQLYLPYQAVNEYKAYIEALIAPEIFLPLTLSPRGAGQLIIENKGIIS